MRWDQRQAHFWLVAGVAAVSLALSVRINEQARTRADARLFLVSLAPAAQAQAGYRTMPHSRTYLVYWRYDRNASWTLYPYGYRSQADAQRVADALCWRYGVETFIGWR